MGSSCECRVPQFRHRRIAPAEFARLELPLLDLLCQLDSRDRYHRVIESFESQHRPDSLLHSPVVLLHQIVQVLAGSNLDATWLTRTDRQSLQIPDSQTHKNRSAALSFGRFLAERWSSTPIWWRGASIAT
jgi:hypothetical protein